MTKDRPLSVREIAEELDAPLDEILEQIVVLRSNNLIALDTIVGVTPKYRAIVAGGC